MEYFYYKGVDSRTLGVYMASVGASSQPLNMSPPSTSVTDTISGRHGSYVMEQLYGNRIIEVPLYLTRIDSSTLNVISRWLSSIGTHELILSTEPYKVYRASVEQGLILNAYNPKQGIVIVTFSCYDPFAYSKFSTGDVGKPEYNEGLLYDSGLLYATTNAPYFRNGMWTNPDIYHGGNTDLAMPKIKFVGNIGTSNDIVYITHYTDSTRTVIKDVLAVKGINNTIIDCERMEVRSSVTGDINKNVEGNYFKLYGAGDMTLVEYGGMTPSSFSSAVLSSRSGASSLVGKVITFFEGDSDRNFQVVVQSQVGNTVTFATNKDITLGKLYMYKVIDFSNGMNYFTIDAGAASTAGVTNITFDFKFVYL